MSFFTSTYDRMSDDKQQEYLTNFLKKSHGHRLIHELFDAHDGHYGGAIDILNERVAQVLKNYGIHDMAKRENRDKLAYIQGLYSNMQNYLEKSKLRHANFSDTELLAYELWNGNLYSESKMNKLEHKITIQ